VPPEQRSHKPDGTPVVPSESQPPKGYKSQDRNLVEQGRQGAIKQNTTNKGLQQDR
jgi:hypothetical protein